MTETPEAGKKKSGDRVAVAAVPRPSDLRRGIWLLIGVALFAITFFLPGLPDATDPEGRVIALSNEGRMALGLFLLAATWWVTEAIPIGVTAIAIGVIQALFQIRSARTAFTDFMDPEVWFIIGSVVIGMVFTKTGLTNRLAYRMLTIVGERTSRIYLGAFVMTAAMTLVMAHTAVAAAVFPLLMTIYALYEEDSRPTRFGKGLFIGNGLHGGRGQHHHAAGRRARRRGRRVLRAARRP